MTCQNASIAIFVKTPGLSPIKTRLSVGIGRDSSAEFYRLSVAAISTAVATVAESTGTTPYWAVAEEAGLYDPRWQEFSRIPQGSGGLGDRLHKVFNELQSQHAAVIGIGADSPQITPALLESTLQVLLNSRGLYSHVLGRCCDGGFYLVGSNSHLAKQTWTKIPYSTATAAESLAQSLRSSGQLKEIASLTDVDTAEDLITLKKEMLAISKPSPEQLMLIGWLERNISQVSRKCK